MAWPVGTPHKHTNALVVLWCGSHLAQVLHGVCGVLCVLCCSNTAPTAMVLVSMCVCTSNSHLLCGNCSIDCVVVVLWC